MWNCAGDDVVVTAGLDVELVAAIVVDEWCPDPDAPLLLQATNDATKTAANGRVRNGRITANAISLGALGTVERHGAPPLTLPQEVAPTSHPSVRYWRLSRSVAQAQFTQLRRTRMSGDPRGCDHPARRVVDDGSLSERSVKGGGDGISDAALA